MEETWCTFRKVTSKAPDSSSFRMVVHQICGSLMVRPVSRWCRNLGSVRIQVSTSTTQEAIRVQVSSSTTQLSFFSNSSSTSSINNSNSSNGGNNHLSSSGLLIPDHQFNNGNASGEGNSLFSGNMMGEHIASGVSSLYNTPVQNESIIPQMSATALLQKAAQMGSTTSGNGSSLLRSFGSSSSGSKSDRPQMSANFRASFGGNGEENMRSQIENENQFQDLMNSLANGSSIFGTGSGGVNGFGRSGGHEQETGFGGFNANRIPLEQHHQSSNFRNVDIDAKLHQNRTASISGSDRLTRDFLGVGGIVRSMSGGISQREQQHLGIGISSLDSEIKSAAAARPSFRGGNLH